MPRIPYRGIRPFRYLDRAIFFARDEETRRLAALVSVYRGVLLYGDSGSGKSSLVNAGLIPEAIRLGFAPERLRVQPRASEELVVERIGSSDDNEELLPSVLALDEQTSARTVLAIDAFEERVRAACERHRPLLIFDQFEEIVTLFDESGARDARRRLVELLVRLLRGSLPVKVLFSFREDYLGKVKELLSACPELIDQALRLASPTADTLPTIIRGPFERYPGHFARQLSPALADRLVTVLADHFGTDDVSLSEAQTVCLRLWQSDNPEALLAEKGPQGLLEDYLGEALDGMPAQLRPAAIALLAQMVTSAGTRNVISAGDLFQRVQEQEGDSPSSLLEQALEGLSQSRLVRRERRRDLDLYEITSEFLVPWISRRRDQFRRLQDRRRERRRLRILGCIVAALLLVVALVSVFYVQERAAHASAIHDRNQAIYTQTLAEAQQFGASNTPLAAQLNLAAYRVQRTQDLFSRLLSTENTPLSSPVTGGSGAVYTVAFSRVGHLMATGDYDGTLRLWDTANPAHPRMLSHRLPASYNDIAAAAFSPDGRVLATGGSDHKVRLWGVGDPAHPHMLGRRPLTVSATVNSVAFSSDGQVLASGNSNGTIQLWNVADPAHPRAFQPIASGHQAVYSVAFSPHGRTLASGDFDGTIRLWNVADPASPQSLGRPVIGGTAPVESVAFSPDGQILASGDFDDTVRLWNVADPVRTQSLGPPLEGGNTDVVNSVAFSPDGRILASGSYDATVRLWDVANPAQPQPLGQPLTGATGTVFSVAFSPDGSTLAGGSENGTIRLWRLPATLLTGSTGTIYSVAFNPHGGTLASGGMDGMIRIWNVADPAHSVPLGRPLAGQIGGIISVAFSPDGRTLAAGGFSGKIRLWNVADPGHPRALSPPLPAPDRVAGNLFVAFSSNGHTLASGGYSDGTLQLWNVAGPAPPAPLGKPLTAGTNSEPMFSVAFSRNGHLLASGSQDEGVNLWDITHPAHPKELGEPFTSGRDTVSSVAFSHDSHTLAAGSYDGSVQLWNVAHPASPQKIGQPLTGTSSPVDSVAFNTDGSALATGSDNGTIGLWDVAHPASPREIGQPLTAATSYINSVAFSPDSRTLANGTLAGTLADGSSDNAIRLWNLNVQSAITRICATTANDLTPQLWRTNIPQLPYQPPCAH